MRLAFLRSASHSATSVLPVAASHHGGDAVVLFETGENGFERFRLMGTWLLAFRREGRASKPIGNGLQVILGQSFEIGAANAEKAAAVVHDRRAGRHSL